MADNVIFDHWRDGPYGSNLGDIWTMEASALADKLEADGLIGIWEVLRGDDGTIEPRMYCVKLDNPDPEMQALIARARAGMEKWLEAQAANN